MERAPTEDIPFRAELARKAIHLFSLVVPLGMALLGKTWSVALLVPLAFFALACDVLRVRSAAFAAFITTYFGWMMRREEQPPVGGPVSINGATWVLMSAALLALVFPLRIAVPVFVMFMISDAAAALVGRRFGRTPWGRGPRTVEGSAAFLVTGLVIMSLFPGVAFWPGALGAFAGCVAEAVPRPLNDNIRVPLVAAFVIFAIDRFVLHQDVSLLLMLLP